MQYRNLGRSGLRVSAIALGTMSLGGGGMFAKVGDGGVEDARALLDAAGKNGVNLIDTANGYSQGRSEEILGEAFRDFNRDDFVIATKGRMAMGDGPNDAGLSRAYLVKAVEHSLRRLQTDYIDLYQVHEWDGVTPVDETLSALDDLVTSGKIRYIGSSNHSGWQLMKALGASDLRGLQRYVSQQIHYTLQSREAEYELIPLSLDQGVGTLVWSPLAAGLLTGKYHRGESLPQGARHTQGWAEPPIYDVEKFWSIVEALEVVAHENAITVAQTALAWLLQRPGISSLIVGARSAAQFEENVRAVDVTLSSADVERLDAVSLPDLIYPYWHHAESARDRLGGPDEVVLRPYLDAWENPADSLKR